MANFPPLKNHLLRCVDALVEEQGPGKVKGPFLDAGCGGGDVSLHMARRGWPGKAIDLSEEAVARARALLANHPAVTAEIGSLFREAGSYNTALAMDVIEHLENDDEALARLHALLAPGGHLIVSVPSNPREWRWDDDHFGHYRRYTDADLREKLRKAGFTPLVVWDFTFPVFWIMRRAYTRIKRPRNPMNPMNPEARAPGVAAHEMTKRTMESSASNPWEIPGISSWLARENFLWRAISRWQFNRFRTATARGHEIIALARKD